MNTFSGSVERNCRKCGEPMLVFSGDMVHSARDGLLCAQCGRESERPAVSMSIINLGKQNEMKCHGCGATIHPSQNAYLHEEESETVVLCEDCDSIR